MEVSLLVVFDDDKGRDCDKHAENGEHLGLMLERSHPYFGEDVVASENLDRSPEGYYRGDGHAYVGAPRLDARLLAEDEQRAYEAACAYGEGDGVGVAEEIVVVAEHQQQIRCPENHHQFHECDYRHVACHGSGGYLGLAAAEDAALDPVHEIAAVGRGEKVEEHHHGPKAESGREDEVFGLCHYLAGHGVELRHRAIARGVILQEEFKPSGPEEQASEKSEKGLARVAFCKHAGNYDEHAGRAHAEGRIVQGDGR